jgi:3-hydroxyacyl-CoA dehydrogenase/enoyl-CoA hydratase/3-hydroxybutyryl-CoA epimerase
VLFFLQERIKGIGKRTHLDARHVHVIGAGVMGGDIAAWCALRGLRVTLQDRRAENIAKVIKRAHGLFTKSLKVPRLVQAAMDRLIPDLEGLGAARADVVIEAIFENIEAKQNLFRELETKVRADAIIATNTSSIPLQVIGEALRHPERLVGLHFFNPVAKMQLVEIVHGPDTDDKVANAAAGFAHAIGRLPVSVTSTPGFLVNRVLMPYLIEAVVLESEGVPAAVIDKAALNFGMPMGPIQLADTVGLDICLSVAEILSQAMGGTVPPRLRELVGSGYLGRKSGRGFYAYKDDKPVIPRLDPGYSPPQDLTDRLMFRMLNECVACLRENVVEDHDLLDAGVIFGTGFAPFRGGPIHYLKQIGVDVMHKRLKDLAVRYGDRFRDDAGWTTL